MAVQTSFEFRDLRCFASSSDETSYSFLPKEPDLARDPDQRPMLTMVEVGSSAYLLLAARWSASDSDLRALRDELARRTREPDSARISLSYAPVTSLRCTALIGDGSGTFQTLETSTTSGYPPYDAAFNLHLQSDRLEHARAGLRGEPGFLGIEYLADLGRPVSAGATFRSLAEDLLPWLRSHEGGSPDLVPLLEEAVEQGLATIIIEAPDPQASLLAGELYDRVLARAARLLPRWLEQRGKGEILVSVTLEQSMTEPVRAFADVGVIVSTGGHDAAD